MCVAVLFVPGTDAFFTKRRWLDDGEQRAPFVGNGWEERQQQWLVCRRTCGTVLYSDRAFGRIPRYTPVHFAFLVWCGLIGLASQMDDALMAKEAEKADLMKRRQKLRRQLANSRLGGAELERVR